MNLVDAKSSVKIYREDNDILTVCNMGSISLYDGLDNPTASKVVDSEEVSDKIVMAIPVSEQLLTDNKFLFLYIRLDQDDTVMLPVYTGMTNDKYSGFKESFADFTKLYIDQLDGSSTNIPEDAIEEVGDEKLKYLTIKRQDGKNLIVHESDLEYY